MPEEKVLVTGEKPDQGGTKVTYHGDETSPEVDVIFGVPMKKGQSVDLAEHMPRDQALRFANKLKGMHTFEVDGSERAKPPASQSYDREGALAEARRVGGVRAAAQMKGEEPPEGYDAPLQAMLEKPPGQPAPQASPRAQANAEGGPGRSESAPSRSNPPRGR
jgi:hypothetical protein